MGRRFIAAAALSLLVPVMMGAQTLTGSYFLDNSLNRNKLNPAFAPRGSYFQIPVAGNIGAGVVSSLDLGTFMYPLDGQLYTFLNKRVSYDRFESALAKMPYVDGMADANLINFGWKRGKGFWTVDMGIKVNAAVDLPRDLFLFMKKGTGTSGTYNLGNIKANADLSAYAALGYSRDLSDLVPGLRVGAKLRAILPVAYLSVDLKDASLSASPEKWTLNTDGTMYVAAKGLEVMDSEGGFDLLWQGPAGLAGLGFSADLGAEYSLRFDGFINGLSVSAAVTDLGAVKYSEKATQEYHTEGSMDWTGIVISLEEGKTDKALEDLENEFGKLLELKKVGNTSAVRSTLPSFYVGVEMPFCNNRMSIGALYSAMTSYNHTRNELTVSYNLNPAKWFALGVNYSFLNTFKTLGCIMEFTPRVGPCLYLGLDYVPMEYAKSPEHVQEMGIPVLPTAYRVNLHAGLAFALGKKTGK